MMQSASRRLGDEAAMSFSAGAENSDMPTKPKRVEISATGGEGEAKQDHGLWSRISDSLEHHRGLWTLLLFTFLVLKVIIPAKEDIPTALGILETTSLVSTVVGALLSGLPLLAAVALGLVMSWAFADGWRSIRGRKEFRGLALAAGLICAFIASWPMLVASIALGSAAGLIVRQWRAIESAERTWPALWRSVWSTKSSLWRKTRVLLMVFASLLVMLIGVLAVWKVFYNVWLPHEYVKLSSSSPPEVGYVLADSGGWLVMLRSDQRILVRLPDKDVRIRAVCQLRNPPSFYSPFTSGLSLWQEVELKLPHGLSITPLNPCPRGNTKVP
jgi:hypothetical protein